MMSPFVSVIMPVQNEEQFISQSLSAVLAQDYPSDRIEVLIVDGMSTDRTCEIIKSMISGPTGAEVRLLENKGMIVSTGLNLAIRQAKGDVIVRVDGHTVVAPDYVRQCVLALQRTNADNVGGRMDSIGSTRFGKAVALATSTPFGVGGASFHYSTAEQWTDTAYMGAWHRSLFEKIGLFDEELVRNQDDEYNYRIRESGGRILLTDKIRSTYFSRTSLIALGKQYFQYGYWKVRVMQKHLRQMSPRQFVPPLFVISLILSVILALFPVARPLSLAIPSLYILTNFAASIRIAARHGWEHLPLLPIVFTVLHLSYGLGFLAGLFKFWHRWGDKLGKVPSLSLLPRL